MESPGKILISREEISLQIEKIAAAIAEGYQQERVLFVGVLKGASIFLADLIRCLDIPLGIDYMAVSSYGSSTKSSGVVRILKDLDENIEGKNVILVEDIVDTGLTLHFLLETLKQRFPRSIQVASLLDKPAKRQVQLEVDYCGFTITDHFVVGYGLDYNGKYRNLPDICVLEEV